MTGAALLTHLRSAGVQLICVDGLLELHGDEELLTDEMLADIRTQKEELLALLTPRLCVRCDTQMTHIEFGYYSCPACYFQIVEPRSGFWCSAETREEYEERAAIMEYDGNLSRAQAEARAGGESLPVEVQSAEKALSALVRKLQAALPKTK